MTDIPISIDEISTAIGADVLQGSGETGAGVVVGIIDSGVNNHNLIKSKSFVGGDLKDYAGHGTAIADIIVGIAPDVSIISAKIYNVDSIDVSVGVEAIRWCAEQGCNIINCSWGTRLHYQSFHDVIAEVKEKYGTVCVFPTGNYGFGTLLCPAEDENAIGVGSVPFHNSKYYISAFSGYGTNYKGQIKPDLVAFGGGLNECIMTSKACVKGTSFSVPVVVGALALIYHSTPDKDALVNTLISNSRDVAGQGVDEFTGHGLVNVHDANNNPIKGQYLPADDKKFKTFSMLLGLGAVVYYLATRR